MYLRYESSGMPVTQKAHKVAIAVLPEKGWVAPVKGGKCIRSFELSKGSDIYVSSLSVGDP